MFPERFPTRQVHLWLWYVDPVYWAHDHYWLLASHLLLSVPSNPTKMMIHVGSRYRIRIYMDACCRSCFLVVRSLCGCWFWQHAKWSMIHICLSLRRDVSHTCLRPWLGHCLPPFGWVACCSPRAHLKCQSSSCRSMRCSLNPCHSYSCEAWKDMSVFEPWCSGQIHSCRQGIPLFKVWRVRIARSSRGHSSMWLSLASFVLRLLL